MASIGNLAVTLTANTASFVRNLGKASVGVKSFERSASSVTGTLKKLAAGLAAVAGAAGTVALIKNSFKLIDAQAKTADKLGLTTEALAGLRLAASRSGVATSALDTGLQRMTRRVAEAAKGTGEARNAIAELGLDAKKLVAQSPDEQFKQIAEAMNRVDRQTDRVRLSFKLFDTEGVALVNTLASGRSGLDAAEAAARRFGTAVSRIDAAKIEIANDAIADLMKTYVQYPPRKLQSESYSGPITITAYQRFQYIRDALEKDGVTIGLPTGN